MAGARLVPSAPVGESEVNAAAEEEPDRPRVTVDTYLPQQEQSGPPRPQQPRQQSQQQRPRVTVCSSHGLSSAAAIAEGSNLSTISRWWERYALRRAVDRFGLQDIAGRTEGREPMT